MSTRLLARECVGLASVLAVSLTVHAAGNASPVGVCELENTPERVVLHYSLDDFTTVPVTIDGREYVQVALGKESPIAVAGAPDLPNVCRSVIIGDDAEVAVRVLASRYNTYSDVHVAPSKGILLRSVDPTQVPYTFGDAYETDAFFPGELATVREPYILRDYRATVIELNPFQYNPVTRELRAYTEVELEVVNVGPARVNALVRRPTRLSLAFHKIYMHHFVNYAASGRYAPLDERGEMLIICHDAWMTNVQPLVDHKNGIGIPTTMVGVSTIGNDATSIGNYIQNVYDTSDLSFVLLVGDSAQVATPHTYVGSDECPADPNYALVAGDDHYPDILVGRFSAETAAQVDTQVLRTIEYEQPCTTEQAWFKRGTGIGSAEGAGQGDDGEADWEHIDNIRIDLIMYGYTQVDHIYDPGATAGQVTSALNNGRGIINYCGQGDTTSWLTTGFSNAHVNNLTNENMLPFIISVAGPNGRFDGNTCFAEAWMRATNGSEPTGAIGIYASSAEQYWAPPMCAQDEAVDLLVAEAYFSFGALCFAGSCQMMDEYGQDGVDMYLTWHLFADPSLRLLPALTLSLPAGAPEIVDPGMPTPITVQIQDQAEIYVPGSGLIHCRVDGGAFSTDQFRPLGGGLYEAVLPAVNCDDVPEFYFSAQGDGGTTVYLPLDAPADFYSCLVGTLEPYMEDDFETDQGWTVENDPNLTTGAWERGVPVDGQRGDPPTDYDGSGACYLTENVDGDSDVDGGITWLISPRIDRSGGDAEVRYALWYTNLWGSDPDNDLFKTYVSNDNGASWVLAQTIGPESHYGWNEHSFMVGDFVTPTAEVKVRFEASDLNEPSVVEAGIDAFAVFAFSCELPCHGDLDGDYDIDISDLSTLLGNYGMTGAAYGHGDLDDDGDVDLTDLAELLGLYGTVCVACPGDLTGDNVVDLSDLAQLVGNYGMTSGAVYTDGDLDFDGDVDLNDLTELLGLYGTTCR